MRCGKQYSLLGSHGPDLSWHHGTDCLLYKVIFWVSVRRTGCKSWYFKWWFQKSRIWNRTTKTIWPVIGSAAIIGINTHESIMLVIIFRRMLWCIHRDQVIIGTEEVNMSVVIRKKPCLQHLIWRNANAWHRKNSLSKPIKLIQWQMLGTVKELYLIRLNKYELRLTGYWIFIISQLFSFWTWHISFKNATYIRTIRSQCSVTLAEKWEKE